MCHGKRWGCIKGVLRLEEDVVRAVVSIDRYLGCNKFWIENGRINILFHRDDDGGEKKPNVSRVRRVEIERAESEESSVLQ